MVTCRAVDGGNDEVIVNDGYPPETVQHLVSGIDRMPEFGLQFRHPLRLLGWENTPGFADSYTAAEVLQPAGYRNGFTLLLQDDRRRIVGASIGNFAEKEFTETCRNMLNQLRPVFARDVVGRYRQKSIGLSPRERQVLAALQQGLSNTDIADAMTTRHGRSRHTWRTSSASWASPTASPQPSPRHSSASINSHRCAGRVERGLAHPGPAVPAARRN